MYDLKDLRIIKFISEEVTLGAVAARARLSDSAISIRLKKLEEYLCVKLVNRSGRFGLTRAGQRFLETAEEILEADEKLKNDLQAIKTGSMARLSIMCDSSIAVTDLPKTIDSLLLEFPYLNVSIMSGSFAIIRRSVSDGTVDIGILAAASQLPGIDYIQYRTDKLVVLTRKSHALAFKAKVSFADVIDHEMIGVTHTKYLRSLIDAKAREIGKMPQYRAIVDNYETQCSLASTNLGCALVLESVAVRYLTEHLTTIPLTDDWAAGALYLCSREKEQSNPVITCFKRLMKSTFLN